MNVTCSAPVCPVILNSSCVFYEGESLVYTGINTNDSLQVALQKIDAALGLTTVVNIYNSDGVLTGNRNVFMNNFTLSFEKDVFIYNARVGRGAGAVVTNTVLGNSALNANTTGQYNTAVGISTLNLNTTGNYNTALGAYSLSNATTAEGNTGVGTSAMTFLTTGYSNTAVGFGALYKVVGGYQNVGVGRSALYELTSGNQNIGIGLSAGSSITTGSKNTIIGWGSGQVVSTGSSNTIIGANVSGLASTTSNNIILSDGDGNVQFKDDGANTILPRLAGVGTRMVVAGATGALSSQAIPTGNITGTGANGQVAYWTGASTQAGNNNLFWDNAQGRLGIGNNVPAVGLDTRNGVNLYTSGTSPNSHYLELISNSGTDGYVNFRRSGGANGPVAYYLSGGLARFSYNAATGDTILGAYSNNPLLLFTNSAERVRIDNLGNVGIGVTPTALTDIGASTTARASLRLREGVAPTTPNNGDIWSTTTDLLARINGTTYSLINSGLSGSGAAGQVTFWSSATNITGSNNLFWDSATSRLGINTNTPVQALDVRGIVSINTNGQATTISTYRLAGTDGNNIWIGGGGTASTGTASQGSYNTGVGVNALSANTTGSFNNAIGFGALTSNTTGNNNNSIGWNALSFNTTGTSNVAFGHFALRTNGTGSSNVAVGESALRLMTTGNNNVAVGASAMYSANGAQTSNVAVGATSLYNNGGNQNTAIGMESGMGAAPYTNGNTSGGNNIFIGFQSVGESATASNRTFIGNTSTTSTWLGGNLLLGTRTDAGQRLQVSGNTVLTNPPSYQLRLSDGTFKWDLWAVANVTNTDLRFVDNSGNNVMILYNGGNVSIGNNSNNARLSVSGDTRLGGNLTLINTGTTTFTYSGAGSFSHDAVGTGGQLVYNPASGIRYKFAGGTSGFIFGATSNAQTTGTTILISSNVSPNNNVFQSSITPNFTGGGDFATIALSGTVSLDALNNLSGGIQTGIKVAETFSPNTANKDIRYIGVSIQPSINQTAGLTQITRGLYINPSITAAADWRAIETSAGGAYINTTAVNASAILQADSTTKGFLPPRMTVAQRTAIVSPAEGLIVFQTDGTIGLYVYANATWRSLTMV